MRGSGVAGRELDVAARYAGVECSHDEGSVQHVWGDDAEPRSFADRSDAAVSGASIEALVVLAAKDRDLASLTDCEIDGSCRARRERNHRWLVSLTEDAERAVTAFEAEVDRRRSIVDGARPRCSIVERYISM